MNLRKIKKRYLVIAVAMSAVIAYFLLKPHEEQQARPVVHKNDIQANQVAVIEQAQELKEIEVPEQQTNFITEDIGTQIASALDHYEHLAQYPAFSVPIKNHAEVFLPKPFEQASVETPLLDDDGELLPISLSAAVDKFEYFVGDTIQVRFDVKGLEENQGVQAAARLKKLGKANAPVATTQLSAKGSNASKFTGSFDTRAFDADAELGEMIVAILVDVDGQTHSTTVPLTLQRDVSATLENVGIAYIDGAFLEIPLEFSVSESGYYFVQSYLFDAQTDRPLLALQAEGNLEQGNSSLNLRAHQKALRDAGSVGPYTLKTRKVYRAPKSELNEFDDGAVLVASPSFEVNGFEFEEYAEEAYSDPLTQKRIRALRELSTTPN